MTKANVSIESVEMAWQVLEQAGIITSDDRKIMEQRQKDRRLLGLAADTLTRAKAEAGDIVSVSIVSSNWVYIAETDNPPRVVPRVTRRASKANDTGKANAGSISVETLKKASQDIGADIPTDVLKRATDDLSLKWFGRANALRSPRVIARARELMGQA